jgi:hypothetical protein
VNTPYYDAIDRELFIGENDEFLGFYYVGEQLYYIFVSIAREG